MRTALLLSWLVISSAFSSGLPAQDKTLTSSTLPGFLADYKKSLGPVDAAYTDLANENLPLRDENGQPLGRRPIDDRRQQLTDLRQAVRQLAANPQDLALAISLFVETETLADDLFDLSQIAYDNDREELGKRLSDLQAIMDRASRQLESYGLHLATECQERIRQLEKENQELQQKLKEAAKRASATPRPRYPDALYRVGIGFVCTWGEMCSFSARRRDIMISVINSPATLSTADQMKG